VLAIATPLLAAPASSTVLAISATLRRTIVIASLLRLTGAEAHIHPVDLSVRQGR
jgi:hypothetical protein